QVVPHPAGGLHRGGRAHDAEPQALARGRPQGLRQRRRGDLLLSAAVAEIAGLTVEFGNVRAVDGLDLTVRPGAAIALVGRNGAGKSTTLRALAGVLPPTSGSVVIGGVDARRDPGGVRERVGYCPDVGGLIPRATPWEHLT